MKNLSEMMQKAQDVQRLLGEMQAALSQAELQGQSGGGMVQVTLSGRGEARKIQIDPKVINPSEAAMLEDLIIAAYNDARAKVEAHVESKTQEIMGGMMLPPGIKLPF
ncbi:MAG: YbaB/EbfC family nucleoid-associated protein [Proteobacteria bacterium]|nr:YbaB/EbfC family nucleoid-associated protein [Pseudomonadota bacterium]